MTASGAGRMRIRPLRRRGIGRRLAQRLVAEPRRRGTGKLVVEALEGLTASDLADR